MATSSVAILNHFPADSRIPRESAIPRLGITDDPKLACHSGARAKRGNPESLGDVVAAIRQIEQESGKPASLVTHFQGNAHGEESIYQACVLRFRPILMTTM